MHRASSMVAMTTRSSLGSINPRENDYQQQQAAAKLELPPIREFRSVRERSTERTRASRSIHGGGWVSNY